MNVVSAYTDGGIIGKNPSTIGGSWAYVFLNGDGRNVGECSGVVTPEDIGLPAITNNLTELFAAVQAMCDLPDGWAGTIFTDSYVTLCRISKKFPRPKFNGIPAELRELCLSQRYRLGAYGVELLAGHPTADDLRRGRKKGTNLPVSVWNVHVDKKCGAAGRAFVESLKESRAV